MYFVHWLCVLFALPNATHNTRRNKCARRLPAENKTITLKFRYLHTRWPDRKCFFYTRKNKIKRVLVVPAGFERADRFGGSKSPNTFTGLGYGRFQNANRVRRPITPPPPGGAEGSVVALDRTRRVPGPCQMFGCTETDLPSDNIFCRFGNSEAATFLFLNRPNVSSKTNNDEVVKQIRDITFVFVIPSRRRVRIFVMRFLDIFNFNDFSNIFVFRNVFFFIYLFIF